jgi:hypothetical protein
MIATSSPGTVEEGLHSIRDQGLFTGSWEDNLDRRKARVASIRRSEGFDFFLPPLTFFRLDIQADEIGNGGQLHWRH